jgi:starch synthase
MRVLFLNENIGGHTAVHVNLREALVAHPEVTALFYDVPRPGRGRRIAGAAIPGLGHLDLDFQPLRAQLALSWNVRRRLAAQEGAYDVLHVYTHNAGLLSIDCLRRHPSVVSTDATGIQYGPLLPQRRATRFTPARVAAARVLEQRSFDAATIVVAQSRWTADSLRTDYGVSDDRLRLIPFGIAVPEIVEPTDRSRERLPRVAFVGNTMDRKGGWRLLDVWRRRLRQRCELVFVTRERVQPEPGVEVIRDIRPGDGRVQEILAASAVMALPTDQDISPNAVLEAMAVATPVVATRMAAIPELVTDGVSGLLIEPGDDEALGDALEKLLLDEELRRRIGAAARARVLEHFDCRVTTPALVQVLAEATELHGRRGSRPAAGTDRARLHLRS